MRVRFYIAGALLLILSQSATALDLNRVYGDALAQDPAMARAMANLEAVRARVIQARAPMLPSLGFNYSKSWSDRSFPGSVSFNIDDQGNFVTGPGQDESFDDKYWESRIGLSLFNAPNWFALRGALASRNRAEFEYAQAEQDLVRRVLSAYLDVLEAQDSLEAVQAEFDSVSRQREQMQQRFDVGLVPVTDVLDAVAVEDSSYVRLLEANALHDAVFEVLASLTGTKYDSLAPLSQEFEVVPPSPLDEQAWVEAVLEANFGVRAAGEAVDEAKSKFRGRSTPRVFSTRIPLKSSMRFPVRRSRSPAPRISPMATGEGSNGRSMIPPIRNTRSGLAPRPRDRRCGRRSTRP